MIVSASPRPFDSDTLQAYMGARFGSLFYGDRPRSGVAHQRLGFWVMVIGAVLSLGCADDTLGPPAPSAPGVSGSALGSDALGPACAEGATEACHVVLGEHAGVISCYEGIRHCNAGSFGPCRDGEAFEISRDELGYGGTASSVNASLRPLAFSPATECENNPCNRYCREFNEAPADGIGANLDGSAPPLSSWATGNLSDYPPEWVVVGAREPCQVAADCQFNTTCTDPASGSCTHSVCASGEALEVGCNRCSDAVCAVDPSCCGTPLSCSHDPCEVGSGAPLDRACDTCVAAVCDTHPECCDASWNDACVGYVATECAPLGQSCGCPGGSVLDSATCYLAGDARRDWGLARDACGIFGTDWNLLEINGAAENAIAQGLMTSGGLGPAWLGGIETTFDEWTWQSTGEVFFVSNASGGALQPGYTYENWAADEPELGVQGRGIAMTGDGEWHDAPLTSELDYVCKGPPNRLGPRQTGFSWGAGCVELARSECGVQCPTTAPLGLGSCTARVATDLDPGCPAFDLALGATCEEAGAPQVPVCNHGLIAAPAGLRLSHVSVAELGKVAPDLSAAGDCVLDQPVPPGRCVTVTNCPGLTPDRALVVNPIDGAEDASECRFDDNWTIYQPVACGTAVCEAGLYDAAQVAANGCGIAIQNPLSIDTTAASVSLGTGVPEPTCGAGEVRWGSSCYFFSTEVQTWDVAQNRCEERGAGWGLVALNSPAENSWVRSESDPASDVQIGLDDKLVEGAHVWSNGSCRSWNNWHTLSLQPNNIPPGSEQCVRMTAAAGEQWEDKACNDGEHPYACEGPTQGARGGCASGQMAGPDGSCYAFDPGGASWAGARDTCQAMGPGWALVAIEDEATNDFVSGLINCTATWLGNPPGAYAHWALGESVNLSNDPYIDELGFWRIALDGAPRATLCQGPAAADGASTLVQVPDLANCSGGDDYFFEGNDLAPETLMLCPETCALAASVPGRRVDVEIPCAAPPPPALETTVDGLYYEPDCNGGSAVWDFFYYDAVTPADSRIEFEIRTGPNVAELAANTIPFVPIAQAHSVPTDTQRCESPTSSCPVDIFSALGPTGQQQSVLELRVVLFPGASGEGPLLRDWKVRFSCPPSQ